MEVVPSFLRDLYESLKTTVERSVSADNKVAIIKPPGDEHGYLLVDAKGEITKEHNPLPARQHLVNTIQSLCDYAKNIQVEDEDLEEISSSVGATWFNLDEIKLVIDDDMYRDDSVTYALRPSAAWARAVAARRFGSQTVFELTEIHVP